MSLFRITHTRSLDYGWPVILHRTFLCPSCKMVREYFKFNHVAGIREHVSCCASMSDWAAYIHIYVMRIPHAVRIENVTACFAFVFTKSHFAQAINYVVSAAWRNHRSILLYLTYNFVCIILQYSYVADHTDEYKYTSFLFLFSSNYCY